MYNEWYDHKGTQHMYCGSNRNILDYLRKNTMITKMFSMCIVVAMVIYWFVYERNTRKRKKQELQREDYLFAKEND